MAGSKLVTKLVESDRITIRKISGMVSQLPPKNCQITKTLLVRRRSGDLSAVFRERVMRLMRLNLHWMLFYNAQYNAGVQ